MARRDIVTVGAALSLGLSACAGSARTTNPPEPVPVPVPVPDAEPDTEPQPASALPAWDDVASGHPAGATNPPIPELIVTPDGRCFKAWVSPMMPRDERGDRVDAVCAGEDCGTEIVCLDRAAALLEAWKDEQP